MPPLHLHKSPEPTGAGFRLRAARRGDAMAPLLAELGYPGGTDSQTVNWVISHPEMELFVATDGHDRAIGMITLSHRPQLRLRGRVLTVDELVVAPDWRRKGVGRALIQRALERARSLSVKRVEVAPHPCDPEAASTFLVACGFQPTEGALMRFASAP